MGEYFKPWRRKIGVVTLVMACVFAGAWVRSILVHDVIRIGPGNVECIIVSHAGIFSIWVGPDSPKPTSSWKIFGPIVTAPATHPGIPLPYSIIVIPLTLLSAYLLFSKQRKSYVKPINESVPETAM